MKDQVNGFLDFIRTQGVVGLAVGVMIGGAVGKVVTSIVQDLINPLIGVALGPVGDLSKASLGIFGAQVMWGNFVSNLINFIIVAMVVYFGIKSIGLEKLDKPKA